MVEPVRTATEVLIKALEGFAESEPRYCMVIWVDENGDICMTRSDVTNTTWQLGLLTAAQMMVGVYLGVHKERDVD